MAPAKLSDMLKARMDAAIEADKPLCEALYQKELAKEEKAEEAKRKTVIEELEAILKTIPNVSDADFKRDRVVYVRVLVNNHLLDELPSVKSQLLDEMSQMRTQMVDMAREHRDQLQQMTSMHQAQTSGFFPRSTFAPLHSSPSSQPSSSSLVIRSRPATGAVPIAVTSGSTGSSATVEALGSDLAAIAGPNYGSPYMDRKAMMIPSRFDGKEDVESRINSMRVYFEEQGTQRVNQSLILATNVEPVVRGFLEVQAMQDGYTKINLSEWLEVTAVTTLKDILVEQYKDPHAAARVRMQLDELQRGK
ncbi:hypothetical protein CBR_g23427 [Chara braunii]|uniref:Uncharacterized protein n=1 Tax=Chara braunii TaxID=69332 RepID=A0A388L4D2_CHABU|nr:hypothetical protein CBR_g23427 [Chara braunii]|eukprot:GBG77102.1 hypothetical protein CBR_g23427 [Chara braunii]